MRTKKTRSVVVLVNWLPILAAYQKIQAGSEGTCIPGDPIFLGKPDNKKVQKKSVWKKINEELAGKEDES